MTAKKNTKFHGHRIISFENIEIFLKNNYMYVEYQKNHIKLDLNSTFKCFSTTDFWWMYLTWPLDNIYRTPTQNCNGLVTASTTFVTDFACVK